MFKGVFFTYITLFSVAILSLGVGFFFGQKIKSEQNQNQSTKEDIQKIAQVAQAETRVVELKVAEVYFFRTDQEKICPKEYPIKAKYGVDAPIFYQKTNKFYARVKPHLCFTSKEVALDKGFVEKK